MDKTLAQAVESEWVSLEHLNENYKPVLEMVHELIGVIPNCNPILEIWPTGFRTFNLLLPNMLNLPGALIRVGAPKDLVGIAMYASSNAAECPYCTAHHCSFAIRRGADPSAVLGDRTPTEAAVANLAEAMAVVPSQVTPAHIAEIEAHLGSEDVEWIVLAVSLGGFLNKFMDAMGIRLEDESISDVQALLRPTGWRPGKHVWSSGLEEGLEQEGRTLSSASWTDTDTSADIPVDNVGTYLRVLRQAPGAAWLEKGWTRGVSGRIGPALLMLEEEVGYAFPILGAVRSQKVVKAIATALRDNLDPELSRIGLATKLLAGVVYAGEVGSETLASECTLLFDILVPDADPRTLAAVRRFAESPAADADVPPGLSSEEAAVLLLAKAAAPSPSHVSEITVAAIHPMLAADEIVEIIVWLSLLQTLNRLYGFFEVKYRMADDGGAAGNEQPATAPIRYPDDIKAAG